MNRLMGHIMQDGTPLDEWHVKCVGEPKRLLVDWGSIEASDYVSLLRVLAPTGFR